MDTRNAGWHEVYDTLARLLVEFARKHRNPGKVLYDLLAADELFIRDNPWFSNARSIRGAKKMDPVQLFASLNSAKLNPKKKN